MYRQGVEMFEDLRTLPFLIAILWTAVMFWGGLAWLVYALFTNDRIKTQKCLEFDVSDFNDIPEGNLGSTKELLRKRITAPFKIYFKGLFYVFIFGVIIFLLYL